MNKGLPWMFSCFPAGVIVIRGQTLQSVQAHKVKEHLKGLLKSQALWTFPRDHWCSCIQEAYLKARNCFRITSIPACSAFWKLNHTTVPLGQLISLMLILSPLHAVNQPPPPPQLLHRNDVNAVVGVELSPALQEREPAVTMSPSLMDLTLLNKG